MAAFDNWDDDLEIQGDIFHNSISTVKTSISSRLSIRSESNVGEDEWQVPLITNDQQSTSNAILSAKLAGIPIPSNVPAFALLGGSIKRLGKKKSRQTINDDWGDDLELPGSVVAGLNVKIAEKTPFTTTDKEDDDFDDWAEGSLGIRFAGKSHTSKNRSSSASAMSPSMGSCMTVESEEDGLDGLVIPTGPMDFETALKKRQDADTQKTTMVVEEKHEPKIPLEHLDGNKEDFFADIDIGTGDVFDPKKRTLNRNVKPSWKPAKEASPAPRTQTILTFTDKASTKIPRPITTGKSTRLEPVIEAGASNVSKLRRPEPTTTSAQLLRSKRSMPALRNQALPMSKPPPVPFLPAGYPPAQPQNIRPRSTQYHLRRESDPSRAHSPTPPARPHSRLSIAVIPDPPTPTRLRRDVAPAALVREAAGKRNVTRPARRRNFGDGTELESFDDLPTSAAKESKFIKVPSSRPPPKVLRTQPSQSRIGIRDKMTTPMPPPIPKSPSKAENLPRFARDTAASRIAREQKVGPAKPNQRGDGVLIPRINWPAQVAARTPHTSPNAQRTKKGPQLINPMGKENIRQFEDDAARKGMRWNSNLCRWEGNENSMLSFEALAPPSPPRPALITNMAGAQGVQVVGGMVFDPRRMCWLKMGAAPSDPLSPSHDDEDDPFGDIEDLPDTKPSMDNGSTSGTRGAAVGSEWLVGEEFDLGPEFIRRQKEEEAVWRSRVSAWFGDDRQNEGDAYKWAIRELAATVTI